MSTPAFDIAIQEQLRILFEAPKPRKRKKRPEYSEPVNTSYTARKITTGTGTGEGSGV